MVELLVVISIIGILTSMLLPALKGAMKSAQQIECSNHLRQLGLATAQYAEQDSWLPPYAYDSPSSVRWVHLYTDILKLVPNSYNDVWYNKNGIEGRGIFDCPNDMRKLNVSYYINRQITGEVMSYSKWRRLTEINSPSQVLLFSDGWVDNYNAGGFYLDHFSYITCDSYKPDFRHKGQSNVTFVDGHVSACSMSDIPVDTRKNSFWCGVKN